MALHILEHVRTKKGQVTSAHEVLVQMTCSPSATTPPCILCSGHFLSHEGTVTRPFLPERPRNKL